MSENHKEKLKHHEENEATKENDVAEQKVDLKQLQDELTEKDSEIEKLKKELAEMKTTASNYLNTASYYKSQAEAHKKDFERFKERNKNIEKDAGTKANSFVAKKLIPILDDFNSAMAVLTPDVMRGFIMIYTSIQDTLKELGVTEINPVGEKFNPETQECIESIETNEKELDGTVAKVYKKGFCILESNEVVRPATVSVYKLN